MVLEFSYQIESEKKNIFLNYKNKKMFIILFLTLNHIDIFIQ